MDWEALGAIAELLGATGVILSLIYLSGQIRLNTKAIRGSASFEAEHSFAHVNHDLVHDRETANLIIQAYDPERSMSDFAADDRLIFALHARDILQRASGQYQLYVNGLLDENVWHNRASWTSGMLRLPVWAAWWETEKTQSQFSDGFIRELESYNDPARVIRTGVDM